MSGDALAHPVTARLDELRRVAHRYYRDGVDQATIAGELDVSRPTVSRMLREARDRGIVEIRVEVHDYPEHDPPRLGAATPHWAMRAACAGAASGTHLGTAVVPPALVPENPEHAREWIATYCAGCPVLAECASFGEQGRLTGVYGGQWVTDGHPDPAHLEADAAA